MIFVSGPSECVHHNGSSNIWRRDQTFRSSNAEAHAIIQYDGKEIRDRVGIGGCQSEQGCKTPHFEVESSLQVWSPAELFWNGVVSVFLDSCNNEGCLVIVQEVQVEESFGSLCFLRKVNNENVAENSDDAGEGALQNAGRC